MQRRESTTGDGRKILLGPGADRGPEGTTFDLSLWLAGKRGTGRMNLPGYRIRFPPARSSVPRSLSRNDHRRRHRTLSRLPEAEQAMMLRPAGVRGDRLEASARSAHETLGKNDSDSRTPIVR